MIKNLLSKLLFRLLITAERVNRRYSLLGDAPFFPAEKLPWTELIAARSAEICAELDALLQDVHRLPSIQDISPNQTGITTDARWKTFFFKGFGVEISRNRQLCPRTAEALNLIPGMTTAFFSILAPGKVIPPHRGIYNGVLRYHLGLRIPVSDESCAIKVNGTVAHWTEGNGLVFDDTYLHEAWNLTPHWRVVLLVDFLRPLPLLPHLLNRAMMAVIQRTPFVKVALRNQALWEKTFYS